ncbi:heterodisulfide reductase subunit A2 [Candidatus Hakubella thermalkaliphila]|uniref:Heterodisulfide reductase subunit A2 n=5 Tax=Candidatus Hakubella thermalkaliphila TaxID=2754717 RepID=A0A6V8Q442_9ACTN|nr:heterodisulfide reductase subunit A2 [Candidatus Hakubella thermalkaliphila]GFP36916.1 heterodisulfide reductase subunit A2 [Candidatus Hakubella thermalkaliphila]GFP39498.1 heterodisulfide reductase subunit A2 [Candidatus Hakubella thermalkaliphila]
MQASLDLADSGFKVYLAEKSPFIGGKMTQLDKTFPTNDCATCILTPRMVDVAENKNIELLVYSEVEEIKGYGGNFDVKIRQKATYVDWSKCTGCEECVSKCPAKIDDEFNQGLGRTKAISLPFPQAVPKKVTIKREFCHFFLKGKCRVCEKVCQLGAIDFDDQDQIIERKVGAIILAPGYEVYDAHHSPEFGFGRYPNVVTSLQFERLLSAAGPTGGHVQRPSDSQKPKRIAFLQCVGSRDQDHGYCSSVCCMYATKEAILAKEHDPDVDVDIYIMDMRAFGKGYDDYYNRAVEEYGIRYIRCRPSAIKEIPQSKNLLIKYQEGREGLRTEEYDLAILSVGLGPGSSSLSLSQKLDLQLNEYGFYQSDPFQPLLSDKPGVYVCGVFTEPKDIPESVIQASGCAALAAGLLAEARGSLVLEKTYPPEKDVSAEEPRIGVFVCHCGSNIAGVVDVNQVAEYARSLPGVAYVETDLFTCAQDTVLEMREKIKEHNLNRIVVSACTPLTHAPLFQETMQEAGLNPYLFEMANIRNQCSWVHAREPEKATEKAKELVRMSVARAAHLEPLTKFPMPLNHDALVVGGGISGMTASLALADQGFEVYLVEREGRLGGIANRLHYVFENQDPGELVTSLARKVEEHPRIHLYLHTELKKFSGFVGNFRSILSRRTDDGAGEEIEVEHGAIIVATGGQEYLGPDYGYSRDVRILTQLELEEKIASNGSVLQGIKDVVMIQCVGSRTKVRPYCSRICCGEAVKNALRLKEINPEARIFVLYKDIRTYGFMEKYYTEAREKGVIFVRYDDEHLPEVIVAGGRFGPKSGSNEHQRETEKQAAPHTQDMAFSVGQPEPTGHSTAATMQGRGETSASEQYWDSLTVRFYEPILDEMLELHPDLLVLSTGVVPSEGYEELSRLLKAPITQDGFFLEAHVKLRPVDVAFEGIFLCGLSHYPKYIHESIAQAQAAAGRAATILSKKFLEVGGAIAEVDSEKCVACLTCVRVCPYYVPIINVEGVAQIDPAACQGCGICTAECPVRAISLRHYLDEQIIPKVESLLAGVV